jgi:hypothetical protein
LPERPASLDELASLDEAGLPCAYGAHEHRWPQEPSVVAHLLKVAGAI